MWFGLVPKYVIIIDIGIPMCTMKKDTDVLYTIIIIIGCHDTNGMMVVDTLKALGGGKDTFFSMDASPCRRKIKRRENNLHYRFRNEDFLIPKLMIMMIDGIVVASDQSQEV